MRSGARATRWADMDAAVRYRAEVLKPDVLPDLPGVYGWYREGSRIYVGKADSLRRRVWRDHLGRRPRLSTSAFRRNVAEHLGHGRAGDIKKGIVALTDLQRAEVRSWIMRCEVAWLVCVSSANARHVERALKAEFKPPLTIR